MTDDRTGRELTPRPEEPTSAVTPREPDLPAKPDNALGDRFSAGEQAHTVGLTEERAAKIVKQSGNARMVAFLAVLFVVLFIPIYWLYDIGLPVVGVRVAWPTRPQQQQVTDISRGYALFLANCARCHGKPAAKAGIGPPLNDQGKLYNTITAAGAPGPGHLNPNYLLNVLTVGGRYVCGDPNSIMPVWAQPNGPLNYRQVQRDHRLDHGQQGRLVHVCATRGRGRRRRHGAAAGTVTGLARSQLHATARRDPGARLLAGRHDRRPPPRACRRRARREPGHGRQSARDRRRGHRSAQMGRSRPPASR